MKWDCEIIQDLIPSYVDEICSDKSKLAVEEHMRECPACRKLSEQYRLTDFSADKLEETELNGLKKIRARLERRTMLSAALGILLVLLGLHAFGAYTPLARAVYYVLLPVCMLGVYQTGGHTAKIMQVHKIDRALFAGSLLVIAVSVGCCYAALTQAADGARVLGVQPQHAGPLLAGIWGVCFLIQLALFCVLWQRQRSRQIENRYRLCTCITGMFLLLAYVGELRRLADAAYAGRIFLQVSAVLLALGAAGTVVCRWLAGRGANE